MTFEGRLRGIGVCVCGGGVKKSRGLWDEPWHRGCGWKEALRGERGGDGTARELYLKPRRSRSLSSPPPEPSLGRRWEGYNVTARSLLLTPRYRRAHETLISLICSSRPLQPVCTTAGKVSPAEISRSTQGFSKAGGPQGWVPEPSHVCSPDRNDPNIERVRHPRKWSSASCEPIIIWNTCVKISSRYRLALTWYSCELKT